MAPERRSSSSQGYRNRFPVLSFNGLEPGYGWTRKNVQSATNVEVRIFVAHCSTFAQLKIVVIKRPCKFHVRWRRMISVGKPCRRSVGIANYVSASSMGTRTRLLYVPEASLTNCIIMNKVNTSLQQNYNLQWTSVLCWTSYSMHVSSQSRNTSAKQYITH